MKNELLWFHHLRIFLGVSSFPFQYIPAGTISNTVVAFVLIQINAETHMNSLLRAGPITSIFILVCSLSDQLWNNIIWIFLLSWRIWLSLYCFIVKPLVEFCKYQSSLCMHPTLVKTPELASVQYVHWFLLKWHIIPFWRWIVCFAVKWCFMVLSYCILFTR